MKQVLKALHQRPIAVYPVYIDLTGSIAGGLLLSQLLYWLEKVDREIWKTDAEILAETRLTQTEFKNAKKLIEALPFMSVTKRGIPPKTFYAVDWDALGFAIESLISSVTYKIDRRLSTSNRGGNLPNKRVGNLPRNTETTSEITSKTTLEPQKENEILTTIHDQVDETAVKVVEIVNPYASELEVLKKEYDALPKVNTETAMKGLKEVDAEIKASKRKKYIYPPTIEELVQPIYEKLIEKKRLHPQIVDCWNWANHQAEAFWLHHDKTGWKVEKLNGAIATWINKAIQYKTVVVPCPINYPNNPANAQPAQPTKVHVEQPVNIQPVSFDAKQLFGV